MTTIRELAPAKINLTLEIAGRRGDGFHELASLVAFASVGDMVTLNTTALAEVAVSGPFSSRIEGANTLDRTLELLSRAAPDLKLGAVHLDKILPVAAGIGGGSADAAALLRAVRTANGRAGAKVDWHALARRLGADVPVCLEGQSLWMTGTGEELADVRDGVTPLDALLVNPMARVPRDKTARVFSALGAEALPADYAPPPAPSFGSRAALIAFMRERDNQLASAALSVVPEIGSVLAALQQLDGIEHAAVSGAGPTCFGVFTDGDAAEAAWRALSAARPKWWIETATLG